MPAALFGILLSALQSVLGFVLRSVIVKFVIFYEFISWSESLFLY
jgi:hypothetical protein